MGTTGPPRPRTVAYVTQTSEQGLSPELRLAQGALSGLRQDLFHDAFAYRPLPAMATDGPFTRRLPRRMRDRLGWTPHVVVAACAFLVFLIGAAEAEGAAPPVLALYSSGPALIVLLTLVRPVLAFWASLASTPSSVSSAISAADCSGRRTPSPRTSSS